MYMCSQSDIWAELAPNSSHLLQIRSMTAFQVQRSVCVLPCVSWVVRLLLLPAKAVTRQGRAKQPYPSKQEGFIRLPIRDRRWLWRTARGWLGSS